MQRNNDRIGYNFQRFDEAVPFRHQLCPDWPPFEFALQGYPCGNTEKGALNEGTSGYEASVISCSPPLFDGANALSQGFSENQAPKGEVDNCAFTQFC
ncbi:hypothetical protein K443DRAFT_682836 [Laccaria amethystina LaAM-08-1]|uniref:Uncharacterized protein n=1 Tax=Laccaria amethystina LaAM-08-1 TaxID=1095629 RepID=A0A0C9WU58_9AGAR|nr:hypothetical protein K443DRAFT_682836 [Laccaria amethystina LaAM-08-1]